MLTACNHPISSTPNMGRRNYAGGVLGRFISRDPIGFNGSLMNLYAYPTNPVDQVDPAGLDPTVTHACDRLFPPQVTFVSGSPYTDSDGYHPVREPRVSKVPGAREVSRASSTEFIQALETSDVLIYTGHHFQRNGHILLSDGEVTPTYLFKRAKKLPKFVYLNACNSSESLPRDGEFPGTTFIGLDDFIDIDPSLNEAIQSAADLTSDSPITQLLRSRVFGVPNNSIVGPYSRVPYR